MTDLATPRRAVNLQQADRPCDEVVEVESTGRGERLLVSTHSAHTPQEPLEQPHPIDQRLDRRPGVAKDLAAERVKRPDVDGPSGHTELRQGRVQPERHLLRRALVECDRRDAPGFGPSRRD
jgi:hypothetical protein